MPSRNTAAKAGNHNRKAAGKKTGFWASLDTTGKMFFTIAICALALLASVGGALALIGGIASGDILGQATPESADSAMVIDSNYNKDANSIDTAQYTSTILEQSPDAGQSYVDETLFLGDSNTARMYRVFDFCSYNNAIGSVGMSATALGGLKCVGFQGISGYKTMPEAVALMQPRRVIITFGTNDLNPSQSAEAFIKKYQAGIEAVQKAYPSVDIIINAIPPLGQEHSNMSLTQKQADEYNKAIVEMCKEKDWKFLNSAEALKDKTTGYAKAGYVIDVDGIHLSETGMQALFDYIRTHSYITEDDRPALTSIPVHNDDMDVTVVVEAVATLSPEEMQPTEAPEENADGNGDGTTVQTYTYWSETKGATCTTDGYTYWHCNEDPSKDYTSDTVPALGHDFVNGYCSRCGAPDPNYVAPVPPTEPPIASSSEASSTSSSTETTTSSATSSSSEQSVA